MKKHEGFSVMVSNKGCSGRVADEVELRLFGSMVLLKE